MIPFLYGLAGFLLAWVTMSLRHHLKMLEIKVMRQEMDQLLSQVEAYEEFYRENRWPAVKTWPDREDLEE